jgi:hypothetical protein
MLRHVSRGLDGDTFARNAARVKGGRDEPGIA